MKKTKEVTIVGAGIAGCFLAILLHKRGYHVTIYEKSSKEQILEHCSKRSFNLVFYSYAVEALKKAGIWETVVPAVTELEGSMTFIPKAKPTFMRFTEGHKSYYTLQRYNLLKRLLEYLHQQHNISIHFNTTVISIDRYEKKMCLQENTKKTLREVTTSVIFGADGVNSSVRTAIQQGQDTTHRQEYLDWEYKQVTFDEKMVKKVGILPHMQHAWTSEHAAIIGFPDGGGSFSALFMLPKEKEKGFASLNNARTIKQFFAHNFPQLLPAHSVLTDAILHNPVGNFVTVYTSPWYYKDYLALVGDAAHGFLPFYGLGMSSAFADCITLIDLMDEHGDEWGTIFPLYQERRKRHTDAIAQLSKESLQRFRRYKKADYFAVYDKVETLLHKLFPSFILPPVFDSVSDDPLHADDYYKKHEKQRQLATYLGISFFIASLTAIIHILHSLKHRTVI